MHSNGMHQISDYCERMSTSAWAYGQWITVDQMHYRVGSSDVSVVVLQAIVVPTVAYNRTDGIAMA